MKTIEVSPRSKTLSGLLKLARQSGLILRSPDGHEFILAEIDDFNREIELSRQNRKLMALLEKRGKEKGTMSMAEVREKLGV